MALKVKWTEEAEETFEAIIAYLLARATSSRQRGGGLLVKV